MITDNTSGRAMALGSTLSLTEISTSYSPGRGGRRGKAAGALCWHHYHIHVLTVLKFWGSRTPGSP